LFRFVNDFYFTVYFIGDKDRTGRWFESPFYLSFLKPSPCCLMIPIRFAQAESFMIIDRIYINTRFSPPHLS
ncbi:MAG: hypothetical protein ACXQTW_05310, partial [Candidatus Methanospirareceae archaeon]